MPTIMGQAAEFPSGKPPRKGNSPVGKKGYTGNPNGRPPSTFGASGQRARVVLREYLASLRIKAGDQEIDGVQMVIRKLVEMTVKGDLGAMHLTIKLLDDPQMGDDLKTALAAEQPAQRQLRIVSSDMPDFTPR